MIYVATSPAPTHRRLWEISHHGRCAEFHSSARKARTALAALMARRLMRRLPARSHNLRFLDEHDITVWDVTADAAAVLKATGWPGTGADQATISVLEAILVDDYEREP